jgi:hypothetical protein
MESHFVTQNITILSNVGHETLKTVGLTGLFSKFSNSMKVGVQSIKHVTPRAPWQAQSRESANSVLHNRSQTIFLRDLFPVCDSFGASSVARWPLNGDVYQTQEVKNCDHIARAVLAAAFVLRRMNGPFLSHRLPIKLHRHELNFDNYVPVFGPPLWSSGQSSWLQIQRSGFQSQGYQIFWEIAGLERGPLRFVNTTEELLRRKSSGSGLEIREYGRRDPSRWPSGTLYPQKLTLPRSSSIVLTRLSGPRSRPTTSQKIW